MRDKIAIVVSALFIFGLFGVPSLLVDVDHIWKILGITSPVNFTIVEGRDIHTPLLFVMSACIFSIIVTAFAFRQRIIGRIMGIFPFGIWRVSTSFLEPIPDNYSNPIIYKRVSYKKNGERK
jgi:hypothetical protein